MAKLTPLYPQFVSMDSNCALRLRHDGRKFYYYRDGGDWSVDFNKDKDGSLTTISEFSGLNNRVLKPITEENWQKCNGFYTPDVFVRLGYEHESIKEITKSKYKYLLIRR